MSLSPKQWVGSCLREYSALVVVSGGCNLSASKFWCNPNVEATLRAWKLGGEVAALGFLDLMSVCFQLFGSSDCL